MKNEEAVLDTGCMEKQKEGKGETAWARLGEDSRFPLPFSPAQTSLSHKPVCEFAPDQDPLRSESEDGAGGDPSLFGLEGGKPHRPEGDGFPSVEGRRPLNKRIEKASRLPWPVGRPSRHRKT